MAASMALELSNTDKLAGFKGECGRLGIPIVPPDINRSDVSFAVDEGKVRYALAAIRNVGEGAMAALVAERKRRGPFKSIADLAGRLDGNIINKRLLENLIKAGALDSLDPNRAKLFAGAEAILRFAQHKSSERSSKQVSLFGGEDEGVKLSLSNIPDWRPMEKLSNEFEAIGFYLSAHPLDAYSGTLDALSVKKAKDLPTLTANDCAKPIRMAGTVVAKRERVGKRGNKFLRYNYE
jgi:DNA polymerase-3 subunit alpha